MALPNGLGAREHGKFRETIYGEVAVGTLDLNEAKNETLNVTASGDTEIIPTPGATEYLTIKGFHFSNDAASKVTVCLKAGTDGQERFNTVLSANGGNFDKNLLGRRWRLPINKPLIVNLSGASDVFVTVEYEGIDEPGEEAVYLSDSITFAEAIAKDIVTPAVADSQSISEALAKDVTKPALSDTMDVSEDLVITGDRTEALEDSEPIAESLANSTTLSLSDAQSIAASIEVTLIPEE